MSQPSEQQNQSLQKDGVLVPRPLSVQLYSVREALTADQPGALDRLAALGFRLVQPYAIGAGDPGEAVATARRLRRDLDAAGLAAPSVHARAPLGESAEVVLDCVAELGARTLVVSSPGAAGFGHDVLTSVSGIRELGEALGSAVAPARDRGFRLGYHNHWREFVPTTDGTVPYHALVEAAGPKVDLEIDIYWVQTGGQDPARLIGRYADRVRSLHVKDGPAQPDVNQTAAGQGKVNLRAAIEAAPRAQWHILELDRCAGDPFDLFATGAQWLVDQGLSRWDTGVGRKATRG